MGRGYKEKKEGGKGLVEDWGTGGKALGGVLGTRSRENAPRGVGGGVASKSGLVWPENETQCRQWGLDGI